MSSAEMVIDRNPLVAFMNEKEIKKKKENSDQEIHLNGQKWWCIDLGQVTAHSEEWLSSFAEHCLRFTPDVVLGKNRIFLEMGRTGLHMKKQTFKKRAHALAKLVSEEFFSKIHTWKWGCASTIPESWVHSQWGNTQAGSVQVGSIQTGSVQAEHLPIESIFDYIDPTGLKQGIQPPARGAKEKRMTECFHDLGLRNLSDLFQVPPDSLLTRFGESFDQFSENYYEGERYPWTRFTPSQSMTERSFYNVEDSGMSADVLIFRPKPIVEPVTELSPRVLETRKPRDIRDRETLKEAWLELISQLSMNDEEQVTSDEEEVSSEKQIGNQVLPLVAPRPLRLFPKPIVLKREGMFLKRRKSAESAIEPEVWRICSYVQTEHSIEHRVESNCSYYRVKVQLTTGERLRLLSGQKTEQEWWVHHDPQSESLALHGVYE